MSKYYIDTCVWRDHYENRVGPNGRPLGKYATKLISKIVKNKEKIILSSHILNELPYSKRKIDELFQMLSMMNLLQIVDVTKENMEEAILLEAKTNVSKADALHAILARNNNAVLVTQNLKDFNIFTFIVVKKPEDL